MTRFRRLTLTTVLAALLAGAVAFAQGPGPGRRGPGGFGGFGGPGGPGGPLGLPLQALNLSEAQQDRARTLQAEREERVQQQRQHSGQRQKQAR